MVNISQNLSKQITSLVKKTGDTLLKEFKANKIIKPNFKSKREIVTYADLLAEKIILQKLKELTPDWHIISEEAGDNEIKSDYLWLIDPLDGTTNFYMGNPLFAVQIALIYKNEPIAGWIYAPYIKEFYWTQKGKGAFLNNKKINVSKRPLSQALLTYCHGYGEHSLKKIVKIYEHFKLKQFDIRQLGSAAIEFGWVAKGKTESYLSPGANPWDVAPGALLVREAGGKVYDFEGQKWQYGKSQNVVATNGVVDKELLRDIKKL